jgi:hypothetical protein
MFAGAFQVTNMDPMVRSLLAIALIATCFLAAACGNDDESSDPVGRATGGTGATGATSAIPPISQLPDGSAESERGTGEGGPAGGGDGSSERGRSRSRSDRSRGRNRRQGSDAPGSTPGGSDSPTRAGEAPPVADDLAAFRLAKEICANVTLQGIALNLRISLDERDDRFVARAFSRGYPKEHREAAYRGCLEGFRNPVKR